MSLRVFESGHSDQYAAFLALAEAGSFVQAAAKLQRHPSVVSKRIAALEVRLGIRLVERSTRQLRFTEAGVRLLDRLGAATLLIEAAEKEAGARSSILTGSLKIALPGGLGRLWLSPLIASFAAAHPEISVITEYSESYVDLLAEQFDVAIRVGKLDDSRLVARRLCSHTRILCASPRYVDRYGAPKQPADLKDHRCLGHLALKTFPTWQLAMGRTSISVKTSSTFRSNDGEALLHAAREGIGILGASNWLVARDLAAGSLLRVLPGWTFDGDSAIYLVRPSSQFSDQKTLAFKEWMERHFSKGAPWDKG